MGKKKIKDDIYSTDQVNKKHRGKSEKLAKRIEKKRNKKKIKSSRFERRNLSKFLVKKFHEHKKNIDINRIPLDFNEIEIAVNKIIAHKDKESINRILACFDKMEKTPKEINLATFENKSIIKDVAKLMKVLRVKQNPKNPLKYSLYHMFKKKDIKMRYTTNVEEIIRECLDSYYLLVKSLFEYYMKENDKEEPAEEPKEENEAEEEKNQPENDSDKERFELDAEYEIIEKQVGRNAELINKAFNRVMNDNGENKKKIEEENEKKYTTKIEYNEEEDKPIKGPSAKDFLAMTMGLINK